MTQKILITVLALIALTLAAAQWALYPTLLIAVLLEFYPAMYQNISTGGLKGREASIQHLAQLVLILIIWVSLPPSRAAGNRLSRLARSLFQDPEDF